MLQQCSKPAPQGNPFRWRRLLFLICAVVPFSPASGVLFISTADPEFNTTAPSGNLTGSGWELQGKWAGYLATPIAPRYFISAQHVGGSPGDRFEFRGASYVAAESYDDPASDLRIWKIRGQFPAFASIYRTNNEAGRMIVVHGRGTQRGAPLLVGDEAGGTLKGWLWGNADGRQRWGENQVERVFDPGLQPGQSHAAGQLLRMTFDAAGGPSEAHLSIGDSSGGLFIRDGVEWKLAGVNYSVEGLYNTTNSGAGFNAAVFDERGLYKGAEGQWSFVGGAPVNIPGGFYAIRVSSRAAWIDSILVQASTADTPVLQSAPTPSGPFVVESSAVVNEMERRIVLGASSGIRFYRIQGVYGLRVTRVSRSGNQVVIEYE